MARRFNLKDAVKAVDEAGALLVFPKNNASDPASLWSAFYPRTPMRWEWDESGDDRVARLWHLRAELSESGKVVYSKWFQGRATLFSRALFTDLIRTLNPQMERNPHAGLGREARLALEVLETESPLSTKALKKATDLVGKDNEATYVRAVGELFKRGLIVGYGEIDDGAFPSLALAATKLIFEDLWLGALELDPAAARTRLIQTLGRSPAFSRFLMKSLNPLAARPGPSLGRANSS